MTSARRLVSAIVAFFAVLAPPAIARAQATDAASWGVSGSYTPVWKGNETLEQYGWFGPGLEGSELTIGLVRGSGSGEWGVSFVRKNIKDGETTNVGDEECSGDQFFTSCYSATTTDDYQGVAVRGVEVHWFICFARPNDRLSIGLNVGGDAGWTEGSVLRTETYTFTDSGSFPGFPPFTETSTNTEVYEQSLPEIVPLYRAEAQVSIALTPALWVRLAGGLNAPSAAAFSISAAYFFGGR